MAWVERAEDLLEIRHAVGRPRELVEPAQRLDPALDALAHRVDGRRPGARARPPEPRAAIATERPRPISSAARTSSPRARRCGGTPGRSPRARPARAARRAARTSRAQAASRTPAGGPAPPRRGSCRGPRADSPSQKTQPVAPTRAEAMRIVLPSTRYCSADRGARRARAASFLSSGDGASAITRSSDAAPAEGGRRARRHQQRVAGGVRREPEVAGRLPRFERLGHVAAGIDVERDARHEGARRVAHGHEERRPAADPP